MENIYQNLHSNQKILIYEMLKRGINVEVLDEDKEIIRASFKGHEELILDRDSSIMPYNLAVLAGDKGFTKRILLEHGIAVPLGEVFKAKDIDYLKDAFHILNCPVVIKPIFGSHGFDVYINLQTDYDVAVAAAKIMGKKGPDTPVLIEEYFGGKEFRVFVTKDGGETDLDLGHYERWKLCHSFKGSCSCLWRWNSQYSAIN